MDFCLDVGACLHLSHRSYSLDKTYRALPQSSSTLVLLYSSSKRAALHFTQRSDVPSDVLNGLCKAQGSKWGVLTSFACLVEASLITPALQSEGKEGRKDAGRRHRHPASLLPVPVQSNEKQAEFRLPQQPWNLFEAIWRQLNEKE